MYPLKNPETISNSSVSLRGEDKFPPAFLLNISWFINSKSNLIQLLDYP